MPKLLLTGGTGYIGSKVLEFFQQTNLFEIILVSSNIINIPSVTNVRFNLLNDDINKLIDEYDPEYLLHLAWDTEHGKFWNSEINILWLNKSIELVKAFYKKKGKRAVLIGTCAEYDSKFGFCQERVTPLSPSNLYGICKNSLKNISEWVASRENKEFVWIRIFHLYGGNENPNRFIPYVITKLLNNEIAYCSEGSQIRDFLNVKDVGEIIYLITKSNIIGEINIGSGTPIQIKEIARMISVILNKSNMISFSEKLPDNEPLMLFPDTTRIKNELGWQPRIQLEEGLKESINYWLTNKSNS
ncbi:MAG: NAD(P)-dependent oxidoreductase [Leptospiraceae bacterium]|nr:NAD(P)-dependent oxidoreductase [Leptospiraceae bacterium]